ncbi:ARF SAR [Pisolithus microcarpus]|nr:ARF SAR [Pisolithus microcarpus]
MGLTFSTLFQSLTQLMRWSKDQDVRILMLGLDSAGKIGEVVSTIPSEPQLAFNVETVQYKSIKFQVWDLGGQSSIRPYWRCYFPNTSAIIYVIDSSDHARLLSFPAFPFSFSAIKQDVEGALKPDEVSERLGLAGKETSRQWSVRGSCATKGEGLEEGLDWLVNAIQKK